MENQKISNLLNLAMEATPREREESLELDVGFDPADQLWDVIVRYVGDIESLADDQIAITPLLGNYAVVTLPQSAIDGFAQNPQIEYVEKPKRLFFATLTGRSVSCINPIQNQGPMLFGKGVLVACIDSGIDYTHRDFQNEDGTTRIVSLWDQTIPGNPPEGYRIGTEYTQEEINQALQTGSTAQAYRIVPSRDTSGHGTAVMGIAAGNGAESGGVYRGVASKSDLLVVKLGVPRENTFPRTTELIQGVDYAVRQAVRLGRPLVINLSFGNSYGSHSGRSLVETYLNDAANTGKTSICVGTGNEGNRGGHTSGVVQNGETYQVEMGVGNYETSVNVQIWKNYQDEMEIIIEHPSGELVGPIRPGQEIQRFKVPQTELLIYYGEPRPYSMSQEIYVDFLPSDQYIASGVWKFHLVPVRVLQGDFDMWLPGGNVLGESTRFYQPTPETTLTIPSTAFQVIAVGAYNPLLQSYADFSGRGYTRILSQVKPDIVAPGVKVRTARAQGGYAEFTGTSFATPFVSGSAALLMEWGIVRENDPYLYGEKLKAYLIRGARQLPGMQTPNPMTGWGALCVKDSLPL